MMQNLHSEGFTSRDGHALGQGKGQTHSVQGECARVHVYIVEILCGWEAQVQMLLNYGASPVYLKRMKYSCAVSRNLRVLCFHFSSFPPCLLFLEIRLCGNSKGSPLLSLQRIISTFLFSLTLGENLLPLMGNNPCDWASHIVCCLGNTNQFVLGHSNDKWNYA